MKPELGLSFRPHENGEVVKEVASRYSPQLDFIGIFDDLGDVPPTLPLLQAACSLPKESTVKLGVVGFAIPKHRSMVNIIGHMSFLHSIVQDPKRLIMGVVPGAWMEKIGLTSAGVQQMRESIESAAYLIEKKDTGYCGKYYQIEPGFTLNFETVQNPILLGAWGPRMAALAGEIADEIKIGGSANPAMVPVIRERVIKGLDVADRSIDEVGIVMGAVTVVDEDRRTALQIAKRKAALYIDVVGDKDPTAVSEYSDEIQAIKSTVACGDIDGAIEHIPDDLAQKFIIAGTPQEIIDHLEKIFEQGVSRVELGPPHGINNSIKEELEGIDLLANKVFPHFR